MEYIFQFFNNNKNARLQLFSILYLLILWRHQRPLFEYIPMALELKDACTLHGVDRGSK